LAKRVEMAKSTDLWCLAPFVPLTQGAKDKQRKVCPMNLRGEVCTANNCGNKHPKVCIAADHGKGKIPKATCVLWHMRVSRWQAKPRETSPGGGAGPTLSPSARRSNSSKAKVRPAMPDMNLVKLEATAKAKELKASIRAAKMRSQGVTYSQVVGGHCIIMEAKIPASSQGDFNVEGYHSYLPHPSNLLKAAKYRIVTLVRSALAMSTKIGSI
jgi:hypothetical protein